MNNRPSPSGSRNSFRIFTNRYVSTPQIPVPLKRACPPFDLSRPCREDSALSASRTNLRDAPAGKPRPRWARNPFRINTCKSEHPTRMQVPREHRDEGSLFKANCRRINTCKSVSKQKTSTPFGINTYKKQGGGGVSLPPTVPVPHFRANPPRSSRGHQSRVTSRQPPITLRIRQGCEPRASAASRRVTCHQSSFTSPGQRSTHAYPCAILNVTRALYD